MFSQHVLNVFASILIAYFVFPSLLLFLILPCWVIGKVSIGISKFFPQLHRPLDTECLHVVQDDIYGKPYATVCYTMFFRSKVSFTGFKERLESLVQSGKFPETKCCLVKFLGWYFWKKVNEERFRLENHLRCSEVEEEAAFRKELDDAVEQPFLHGQPLWEFVVFPNYKSEKHGTSSALMLRAHHSLLDVVSGLSLVVSLEDDEEKRDLQEQIRNTYSERTEKDANHPLGMKWSNYLRAKAHFFLELLLSLPEFVQVLLKARDENRFTVSHAKRTGGSRFLHAGVDWDSRRLKEVARKSGVKVPELVVAAFASGLRRLLVKDEKNVRDITIPYSWLKPGLSLKQEILTVNAFAVPLRVPLSQPDRHERLKMIAEQFRFYKESHAFLWMFWMTSKAAAIVCSVLGIKENLRGFGTSLFTNFIHVERQDGLARILNNEIVQLFGNAIVRAEPYAGPQTAIALFAILCTTGNRMNFSIHAEQEAFPGGKEEMNLLLGFVQDEIEGLQEIN